MPNTADTLTAARVAIAVEDHAHTYYGGPLKLSLWDCARYVTEAYLMGADKAGLSLNDGHDAVTAYLEECPDALTYTDKQVENARLERALYCESMSKRARETMAAGNYIDADDLIDAGEAVNPDHLCGGRHSWDTVREIIETHAARNGIIFA